MRHLVTNILLIVLFGSCQSADDYLHKADTQIDKGDYRKAITYLDKALSKKRYFTGAYINKAYCYTHMDNDDSAIVIYNKVLAYMPENTLTLYNMGLCKYRKKEMDESIDYFNRAMLTKGYNPNDTFRNRITIEYTPAGKEILGIGKYDVPLSEIFYAAALAHYEKGALKKAYNYFTSCISRGFNVKESHYMIALCWLASSKKEEACKSMRTAALYGYSPAQEHLAKTCE